jgi:hypothetical protein
MVLNFFVEGVFQRVLKAEEEEKEKPAQSDLEEAVEDLKTELKKQNSDPEKVKALLAKVKDLQKLEQHRKAVDQDPLATAEKFIAELQKQKDEAEKLKKDAEQKEKDEAEKLKKAAELAKKAAEQKEKVEAAEAVVKNLGEFLNTPTPESSADIQKLITELKAQNELAEEKVGEVGDAAGELQKKLDGLQEPVGKKLRELNSFLEVAKRREEALRVEKEKAEKLKNKIEANQKKLESLNKMSEGNSNLESVLNRAISAVGASLSEIKEEILLGKFPRADAKEKAFAVEPAQVEIAADAFRSASFKSIRSERPTKDKRNLLIRFEADDSRVLVGREGINIRDIEELFKIENLKKMSKESAVRFWAGQEVGKFWKFEARNNNLRTVLVAHVKIDGQPGWIRVAENGEITDRAGKKLTRKALHKNDLNVIEDKLGIHLAEEK